MFSVSVLSFLVVVDLCVALPSETILGRQDAACLNARAGAQDLTCWAALGYNTWFDTWKGPCPGPPGCICDARKPWSDCVLNQYQTALDGPAELSTSCVDLTMPDLCHVPSGDWTKLSENQLATAYASTAVGNLYHFIREWYMAITQSPAPAAVLETLFDQIASPLKTSVNRTDINVAMYLANLMTNYSTDDSFSQSFKNVMMQVVGEDTVVDVGVMNIQAFQNILGQALGKTLNASLSTWNTPYFDSLAKNGALLDGSRLGKPPQLNNSLAEAPPDQSFDITGDPGNLALNSTGRDLLSQDMMQRFNYTIVECGAGEPGGLADQIASLLDTMHHNLFLVMRETAKGKRSQYGFTRLWNTEKWLPIRDMYQKMYDNDRLEGSLPAYQAISDNHPVFICLQPHNTATWAAYAICQNEPRLRAFQQPGTPNLVGLCPSFWALPSNPPRAFCPYKGRITAGFIGTALQLNQQAIIIHQLVRMYLGRSILDPEMYSLGDSMGLNASDAYRNPSTWAYWYSSVIGCAPLSWGDPEL